MLSRFYHYPRLARARSCGIGFRGLWRLHRFVVFDRGLMRDDSPHRFGGASVEVDRLPYGCPRGEYRPSSAPSVTKNLSEVARLQRLV